MSARAVTWEQVTKIDVGAYAGFKIREMRVGRKAFLLKADEYRFRLEKMTRGGHDELKISLWNPNPPPGVTRNHGCVYLKWEHVSELVDFLAGKYSPPSEIGGPRS